MATTKTFPDGVVEIAMSGCGNPPGVGGQAVARSTIWFRVDGGEWERPESRTFHRLASALELAETVAEFRELEDLM